MLARVCLPVSAQKKLWCEVFLFLTNISQLICFPNINRLSEAMTDRPLHSENVIS